MRLADSMIYWKIYLILTLLNIAESAKILLLPLDHPGHVNLFILSGKALAKYGHEVHIVTNEKFRAKIEKAGIVPVLHKPVKAVSIADDEQITEGLEKVAQKGFTEMISLAPKMMGKIREQTIEILENKEIQDRLYHEKYDLALVDGLPPGRPIYAIVYKHNLKYISIASAVPDSWAARVPAMPSVEPYPVFPNSNVMSFSMRLANLLFLVVNEFIVKPFVIEPAGFIEKHIPERPPITLEELFRRSEMFLNNLEINVMDYPRVSAPHFPYVGGIGGSPPNPLEPELEQYVSSAKNGFILVSFGSMFKRLPPDLVEKMFAVFRNIPDMKFIMRGDTDSDIAVPDNAKIVKWLPQNDLLGHQNIRLFVTHGGNNGQTEALFHGVPMVVFPVMGDQHYNAYRVDQHGYGKVVDIARDSAEDITEVVKEVLENPAYATRIQKAAAIQRSLPHADDTIAFWTDHVIHHGSDHLRPPYMDMPLYKLFMLDVIAFLIIVWILIIFMVYKMVRCCGRLCCKKKLKAKDKNE